MCTRSMYGRYRPGHVGLPTRSVGSLRVIAQAAERELRRRRRQASVERLRALQQELQASYGLLPDSSEDIRRMREERDAELADLR